MTCTHDAGACRCGARPTTPLPVANDPGQPALRRRVATHATAKAGMLRGLSSPGRPALRRLTARTDDDFAIALIDAAAVVADVLTFYTEACANEHYLRTATEHRSATELARLLGYQPRPALAPTADLAFTLDPTPGAPTQSLVPAGTAVQSSPDPGQAPAVYETLEDLTARAAWSALRPRARRPHPEEPGTTLALAGAVPAAVGDGVLHCTATATGTAVAFGVVTAVTAVAAVPDLPGRPGAPARTDVTLALVPTSVADSPGDAGPRPARPGTVGTSMSWLGGRTISAADLDSALLARSLAPDDVEGPLDAITPTRATVILLRGRRAVFGSQAPSSTSLADAVATEVAAMTGVHDEVRKWAMSRTLPWATATLATPPAGTRGDVFLDGAAPAVAVGSVVVFRAGDQWGAYPITASGQQSVALGATVGRATRIRVAPTTGLDAFGWRSTTAYTEPERVALADVPAPDELGTATIELDGLHLGLRPGRRVVVTGHGVGDPGRTRAWTTTLSAVVHDFRSAPTTTVTLAQALPVALHRPSTTIHGNVVTASMGETRSEVLGSGDARLPFQSFRLRQPPLTHLSASTAEGLLAALTVRVDGVRWDPVESFTGAAPDARVYVVRRHGDETVVQFGDGVTGARLPTGAANVRAVYRSGSGLTGRVRAGQLSLLAARPAGVTAVTNPAPSVGGDDAESVASVRVSAPLRVTTLGRVVSLADYALYARAFPGVAKAQGVWARAARHRGVLLTVAGRRGEVLTASEGVGASLVGALRQVADPLVPFALVPHVPQSFRVAAAVRTDPARVRADVLDAAADRLRTAFAFEARDLGRPVTASEVLAQIHAVPGVVAATLTALWVPGSLDATPPAGPPPTVLTARSPRPGAALDTPLGAALLVLDAAPPTWEVLP
ncbi:hypothetical protein [Kineococcus aurantiacus]|uniref:Putative phage baseplate assembly protein n=1 Tax=Kineococcus aurantiacus TaxID=37633 RepID=A0A7Y9DQ47_9ACTN|nr:hypothetical protein [Kineococcus aurantiacus]NYD24674.1 putative phage baseplate assembly protein [Kineococcus aurantiacus]